MADNLVLQIYRFTEAFPTNERFGLQSQLRRSAVSIASNIVEGSARRGPGEYRNFLNIATGSSAETAYLIDVSFRLGFIKDGDHKRLGRGYADLTASLKALVQSLERRAD